jgi:hypothetical protein
MPTFTIEYETAAERLILEQAAAYLAEIRRAGATAPAGTVLAACEDVALGSGRRFVRDSLAAAVQARADAQKKSRAREARAAGGGT